MSRSHVPFLVLLVVGSALRLFAVATALLGPLGSGPDVDHGVLLLLMTLQHAAGVAVAVGIYLVLVRWGVWHWLAALAAAPALLDGRALMSEHVVSAGPGRPPGHVPRRRGPLLAGPTRAGPGPGPGRLPARGPGRRRARRPRGVAVRRPARPRPGHGLAQPRDLRRVGPGARRPAPAGAPGRPRGRRRGGTCPPVAAAAPGPARRGRAAGRRPRCPLLARARVARRGAGAGLVAGGRGPRADRAPARAPRPGHGDGHRGRRRPGRPRGLRPAPRLAVVRPGRGGDRGLQRGRRAARRRRADARPGLRAGLRRPRRGRRQHRRHRGGARGHAGLRRRVPRQPRPGCRPAARLPAGARARRATTSSRPTPTGSTTWRTSRRSSRRCSTAAPTSSPGPAMLGPPAHPRPGPPRSASTSSPGWPAPSSGGVSPTRRSGCGRCGPRSPRR